MTEDDIERRCIILFDGVCNLCNASVSFVLQHERGPDFQFASIQSETGRELLKGCGLPEDYTQAVILIDNGNVYSGSTAALKIGQQLRFPWSVLAHTGFIIPQFFRDWVYRQIANQRYRWFGKREVCMSPTEGSKTRFL